MKALHLMSFICLGLVQSLSAPEKPNFVVIFTDDQGYGDLSCFGGKHVSTPRIDQMAAEGSRAYELLVAAPVCTPSRAALMTGCYPKRTDMATRSEGVIHLHISQTKLERSKSNHSAGSNDLIASSCVSKHGHKRVRFIDCITSSIVSEALQNAA